LCEFEKEHRKRLRNVQSYENTISQEPNKMKREKEEVKRNLTNPCLRGIGSGGEEKVGCASWAVSQRTRKYSTKYI
jgi:hypothetical protein